MTNYYCLQYEMRTLVNFVVSMDLIVVATYIISIWNWPY